MQVVNVHARFLPVPAERVGALLDTLATPGDALWPSDRWPAMRLDRPLRAGAEGGHGPIRYVVEDYEPGRVVRFRFRAPRGFDGHHAFDVVPEGEGATLRHVLGMDARGPARLSWPLVYRPLHDALVEDALTRAEASLGVPVHPVPWSGRVRLLRALLARRGRRGHGDPRRPPGQ